MRKSWLSFILVFSFLFCLFAISAKADTQEVDTGVSAVVPGPSPSPEPSPSPSPEPGGGGGGGGGTSYGGSAGIILKGIAYPGARVNIMEDSAVVTTTQADPGANFNVQLNGLTAGTYNIAVYANDPDGRKSPTYTVALSVTDGVVLEVDNIFLAPTIAVSDSEVKKGDTINIFGFSAPSAQVDVMVQSTNEQISKVTADAKGAWFKAQDTSFLEYGSHTAKSKALAANQISPFSNEVGFTVGEKSVKQSGAANAGIADLSGDGRVNLVDFSILLYFWGQKNPANPAADLNGDGVVNLTDLSIMLYGWTG